ncbi:MATE family efflux transporter [Butyrivibrio sp. INlla16]|uniref:MATE family efflux transporter n=1 Tax=Butyrivibrio sp. INlla16 TaxID=1520807 RepID=UPI000883C127|nr:MATE family efflux transporter [Butyrivibrio sp. INlla16]SDB24797.1 putative efflux protein, MATE family [Butyrivibrio sp. INlla16]
MKNRNRKYEIDMTKGALLPKILLFSIPLIISSVLQLLFNAADIVVVGQFSGDDTLGANCVAAIGSTGSVINMLLSVFMGLSVGVNVLAARYFAAKQKKEMEETVHTTVALALIGGIIIAVIGILVSRPILEMMGSPEEVIDLSTLYMRIYFIGMPVTMLYNFGAAILRATGDTRRPLYYLMNAGVINVILNLIFVIGFHMHVAGVALATILAQAVSAGLIVKALITTDEMYKLSIRKIRVDMDKTKRIVRVGLPAGLQGAIFSFSNVLIQSSINEFGSVAMAGSAAAANIEGFVYMAMNSVYQACVSFTSQNVGANKPERIGKVLRTCLAVVFVVGAVMGNVFYFFGAQLVSIYTKEPATIQYGVQRMAVICTVYFLCGCMDVICGSLRGMGYSTVPMIVSIIGACGLRIVWILTVFRIYHDLTVLYISYPVTWTITSTAHLISYFIIKKKVVSKMDGGTVTA